MYYLVRMCLPFWEVVNQNEDSGELYEQCVDVDMDVLTATEVRYLQDKYPQIRYNGLITESQILEDIQRNKS